MWIWAWVRSLGLETCLPPATYLPPLTSEPVQPGEEVSSLGLLTELPWCSSLPMLFSGNLASCADG